SEECGVVKILHLKKRRCSFAGGRSEYRRVAQCESVVIEEVTHALDDFVANFENRPLPRRADPEVALIHEEFDAMLLGCYWKGILFGNHLLGLDIREIHFVSAGSARVFADSPGDNDGRFVCKGFRRGKYFRRNRISDKHPLDVAGTVPDNQELNLAARSLVMDPTLQRNFFANMFTSLF